MISSRWTAAHIGTSRHFSESYLIIPPVFVLFILRKVNIYKKTCLLTLRELSRLGYCCVSSQNIVMASVALASPAMGHWGTCPPLDFQLGILGITRFTDSDDSCARFSVQ